MLNGCAAEDFVTTRLASRSATVRFGHEAGHNYRPRCLRVSLGSRIRFEGPFDAHPLAPGRVEAGIPIDEDTARGPVSEVLGGQSAEFVAATPGRFGYYCDSHVVEGMMGAIEVVESVEVESGEVRGAP